MTKPDLTADPITAIGMWSPLTGPRDHTSGLACHQDRNHPLESYTPWRYCTSVWQHVCMRHRHPRGRTHERQSDAGTPPAAACKCPRCDHRWSQCLPPPDPRSPPGSDTNTSGWRGLGSCDQDHRLGHGMYIPPTYAVTTGRAQPVAPKAGAEDVPYCLRMRRGPGVACREC